MIGITFHTQGRHDSNLSLKSTTNQNNSEEGPFPFELHHKTYAKVKKYFTGTASLKLKIKEKNLIVKNWYFLDVIGYWYVWIAFILNPSSALEFRTLTSVNLLPRRNKVSVQLFLNRISEIDQVSYSKMHEKWGQKQQILYKKYYTRKKGSEEKKERAHFSHSRVGWSKTSEKSVQHIHTYWESFTEFQRFLSEWENFVSGWSRERWRRFDYRVVIWLCMSVMKPGI